MTTPIKTIFNLFNWNGGTQNPSHALQEVAIRPAPPQETGEESRAVAVTSVSRRSDKDRISLNCLVLLKKIVGSISLDEASKDLRKLPHGEKAWAVYTDEFLKAMGDQPFFTAYIQFRKQVEAVQKMIQQIPAQPAAYSTHRKQIQRNINKLLQSAVYQRLKNFELNPLVHFIHMAADIIHNHTEAMSVFEELGKRLIGELPDREYNYEELGKAMDKGVGASSFSSADGLIKRLFTHSLFHPFRSLATARSEKPSLHTYDPYETGNQNAALGYYSIGHSKMGTSAGPNPSSHNYKIFSAINQRNENLAQLLGPGKKAPFHYQIILEGAEKKPSAVERRDAVLKKGGTQYGAMALPLDGDGWKSKKEFSRASTASAFGELFRQQISAEESFVIPEQMMDKELIARATASFKTAFLCLEGTAEWNRLAANKQLSKTLLLGYNAFLSLYLIIEKAKQSQTPLVLDGLPITTTCNSACKQGIDRGAILNMMLRLLVDAHEKGDFAASKEQVYQYGGYIAGRARMVEARRILKDRYDALRNFIDLISAAAPAERKRFLAALNLPAEMRFIPSHG